MAKAGRWSSRGWSQTPQGAFPGLRRGIRRKKRRQRAGYQQGRKRGKAALHLRGQARQLREEVGSQFREQAEGRFSPEPEEDLGALASLREAQERRRTLRSAGALEERAETLLGQPRGEKPEKYQGPGWLEGGGLSRGMGLTKERQEVWDLVSQTFEKPQEQQAMAQLLGLESKGPPGRDDPYSEALSQVIGGTGDVEGVQQALTEVGRGAEAVNLWKAQTPGYQQTWKALGVDTPLEAAYEAGGIELAEARELQEGGVSPGDWGMQILAERAGTNGMSIPEYLVQVMGMDPRAAANPQLAIEAEWYQYGGQSGYNPWMTMSAMRTALPILEQQVGLGVEDGGGLAEEMLEGIGDLLPEDDLWAPASTQYEAQPGEGLV